MSYARNILRGVIHSRRKGEISAAVQELFRNDVANVELCSSEPLHIDVSYAGDDFSENRSRLSELNVGWIETKAKKSKKWKFRYFVISEGVMSYFQRTMKIGINNKTEQPVGTGYSSRRPYRLCSQMVLRDASITILEGNILSIEIRGQERLLRFNDRGELIRWKTIIDKGNANIFHGQELDRLDEMCAEDVYEGNDTPENYSDDRPLKGVRGAGAKFLKNAARAKVQANKGMKRAKDATEARMKSLRSGAGSFIRGVKGNPNSGMAESSTRRRRPTNEMLLSSTINLNCKSEKREPTVQTVVETNNTFKVMFKKQQGIEDDDDVLLFVRVKLYQAFLLSGGQYGRLACGDELLLMEFSAGVNDVQSEFFQLPTSL